MTRVITGVVLAAVFVAITWYAPAQPFIAMMEAIAGLCFIEYAGMAKKKGIAVFPVRGLIAALVIPLAFIGSSSVVFIVMALVLGSLVISALSAESGFEPLLFTLFGVFYVGLAFTAPVLLKLQPEGQKLFLLICCATWGADIGAYYTGRLFGKTKLAPAISPGKTVEGAMGGVFFALLFCGLFAYFLFPAASAVIVAGAGLTGGLIGPAGDLIESMMKRYFGVKDSGTLLPGHGGFLDRADALMLTAPFFYALLAFAGVLE